MCSGTDIAMEAADIILMKSNFWMSSQLSIYPEGFLDRSGKSELTPLPFLVLEIVMTLAFFLEQFLWAIVYNLIGIPLAMGFFLPWGIHLHPMMREERWRFHQFR
ncbi:hypothetical protein KEM48_001337 [Puccinia striiformis f. sp. tritici PST-130]|nr:hypothetical protein KEM48_001337 [Puccinia striiformis f. sp. tritici PST-130]